MLSFCQNRTPLQKTMSKIFLWELFSPKKCVIMATLILCLMDVQTGFKQKMEASLRYLLQYSFYQWISCKLYGSYVWRKSLRNKAHPI